MNENECLHCHTELEGGGLCEDCMIEQTDFVIAANAAIDSTE
ncbi:hypothetical protein [Cohnella zeiphila]|nr:hypothetical protein [Cohnella zeiphila]